MAFFKEELINVKGFLFDVDGVLSRTTQTLSPEGDPIRTSNVKDGFAIALAIRNGYKIGIITGGKTAEMHKRHMKLGITDIYMGTLDKIPCLEDFLTKYGLDYSQVMFMGDDIPDYRVMARVGLPVCPSDAVPEIKAISKYISDREGGEGCVRDVIEQVMRAQGKWLDPESINWSSF